MTAPKIGTLEYEILLLQQQLASAYKRIAELTDENNELRNHQNKKV